MTPLGTVAQLWRYPVKSMGGERLESARVGHRGIPGDRGWAVFDETRGGVTNAKRSAALRACRARYVREPVSGDAPPAVEIVLPNGTPLLGDSIDAARALSELLGRAVSLRALGPEGSAAAPRLSTADEPQDVVRAMNGVLPGEPLADLSEFTPERLRRLREGNFFDAYPLHLLTDASLRTLARLAPDVSWDERRFRPNLFVATTDVEPYPERAWIARRLLAGEATLEFVTECPRCVMVTQAVDDVPQDHRVMRMLVQHTRHRVGVYGGVAAEGTVRVGDPIALLD